MALDISLYQSYILLRHNWWKPEGQKNLKLNALGAGIGFALCDTQVLININNHQLARSILTQSYRGAVQTNRHMGMFDYKDSRKKRLKMRKTERRKLILNPILKTQTQDKKKEKYMCIYRYVPTVQCTRHTFTLEDSVLLLGSARESAANNARFL
jgi:hypothetical protein